MLCGRALDSKLSYDEIYSAAQEVQDKFSESAAEIMGVDLSKFTNDVERRMVRSTLVEAVYGVKNHLVKYALTEIKGSSLDAESISGKWALEKELVGHVQESIEKTLPEQIKEGLEAEDYQEMIDELYTPLNMKMKRDLTLQEASQLWNNANEIGLLSYGTLESSGLFEEVEGFTPNKKTAQELEDLFQLRKLSDDEDLTSAINGSDGNGERDALKDKLEKLRSAINDGKHSVFKDNGEEAREYLLGHDGKKKYLNPEITDGLTYVPRTMQETLDDGQLNLVKLGNQEYLPNGKNLIPFDREEFDISDDYQSDNSLGDQLRTQMLEGGVPETEVDSMMDHLIANGGIELQQSPYQQQNPLDQLTPMPGGNDPFQ